VQTEVRKLPATSLAVRLGDYLELCKLKVVSLIVFTAVVGMFLAVPGMVPLDKLISFEQSLIDYVESQHGDLLETLNTGDWNDEVQGKLDAVVIEFKSSGSW